MGNHYHYISSPISGRTVADWNDNVPLAAGSYCNYYTYDETAVDSNKLVGWTPVVGTGTSLIDMKGYAVYFTLSNSLLDETGVYTHSATYTSPTLTNTPSTTPVFKPASDGWNLMGNPYPTVLDWDATSGWTKIGLDDAIYFWDPANNRYASYVLGAGTNGGTRYIPSMQAFWVKVTTSGGTGSLFMNNSVSTTSTNPSLFRIASNSDVLKLTASNGTITDETIVRFMDKTSEGFDSQVDAYKMMNVGNTPSVYTESTGDSYSINSLPNTLISKRIPVNLMAPAAGNYTFNIDLTGFNNREELFFDDLEKGVHQDIKQNAQYTCQVASGKTEGRFFISYQKEKVVLSNSDSEITNHVGIDILAYQQNVSILFHGLNVTNADVAVYDAVGKLIYKKNGVLVVGDKLTLLMPEVQTGIYMVKVVSDVGNKVTQVYLSK